ncbi:hypothetical protein PVAG01_05591 [Phlyctema vagabunda]|uniref:Uncharacterized protein n=1 Tax=Phlyctema vagabunda TaxID=108571 RepID=A0ABR4PKG5_9HELO
MSYNNSINCTRVSKDSARQLNFKVSLLKRDNPSIRCKLEVIEEELGYIDSAHKKILKAKDVKISELERTILKQNGYIKDLTDENGELRKKMTGFELKIGEQQAMINYQATTIISIGDRLEALENRSASGYGTATKRQRYNATSADDRIDNVPEGMTAVRSHEVRAHVRRGHLRTKPAHRRQTVQFQGTADIMG